MSSVICKQRGGLSSGNWNKHCGFLSGLAAHTVGMEKANERTTSSWPKAWNGTGQRVGRGFRTQAHLQHRARGDVTCSLFWDSRGQCGTWGPASASECWDAGMSSCAQLCSDFWCCAEMSSVLLYCSPPYFLSILCPNPKLTALPLGWLPSKVWNQSISAPQHGN